MTPETLLKLFEVSAPILIAVIISYTGHLVSSAKTGVRVTNIETRLTNVESQVSKYESDSSKTLLRIEGHLAAMQKDIDWIIKYLPKNVDSK